ncbi:MAG: hypothetical protein ACREOO_31715 [bacterium]
MDQAHWFDDLPVLGNMTPEQAALKLRELGEEEMTGKPASSKPVVTRGAGAATSRSFGDWWPFGEKAWHHTGHAFGHIAPAPPNESDLPIRHAGNIAPDQALKNARIKITLDAMRVADYPGRGTHRVLMDFYAQNHRPEGVEHLHFNATYRVRENEHAAVLSYPLFVGLNAGSDGVALKCYTVNVKNEDDGSFLNFLETDVFRLGLQLGSFAHPAVTLFSEMAYGLTRAIARRTKNVAVQDFHLGLDFSNIPTRARLAEGSYLAVQIPENIQTVWEWKEWVFNPNSGRVVKRDDPAQLIPYNYVIFGVSRYEGK